VSIPFEMEFGPPKQTGQAWAIWGTDIRESAIVILSEAKDLVDEILRRLRDSG